MGYKIKWQNKRVFLIKSLQLIHFPKVFEKIQGSSKLFNFNPFVDNSGLLRVGGRLSRSKLDFRERCPIILPSDSFITQLIVAFCHSLVAHQGRGMTLNSQPLTPNHLLTLKSNVIISPPGDFVIQDSYSRKLWRRVQSLASQFWFCFRSEYLQACQKRTKWQTESRDLAVGDIVLLCDDSVPRDSWPLCKVTQVFPSDDGRIRSVQVLVGSKFLTPLGKRTSDLTSFKRPIHKLVLLSKAI